ncbi:formin-like protein 3 [Nymphaea colorata]|uniref:formin-like protein 3 n=1 Tax=Nymphaea colorata TaxID=210225 RepID=UPI00129D4BD6|nr:formin-like protein 3 [Nymphaea colorata]
MPMLSPITGDTCSFFDWHRASETLRLPWPLGHPHHDSFPPQPLPLPPPPPTINGLPPPQCPPPLRHYIELPPPQQTHAFVALPPPQTFKQRTPIKNRASPPPPVAENCRRPLSPSRQQSFTEEHLPPPPPPPPTNAENLYAISPLPECESSVCRLPSKTNMVHEYGTMPQPPSATLSESARVQSSSKGQAQRKLGKEDGADGGKGKAVAEGDNSYPARSRRRRRGGSPLPPRVVTYWRPKHKPGAAGSGTAVEAAEVNGKGRKCAMGKDNTATSVILNASNRFRLVSSPLFDLLL